MTIRWIIRAMKNRKLRKIRQFKAEYSAYLGYPDQLAELQEMLYELDCSMNVKSPNMSGIRYAPRSHDERLAEFVTKRENIVKEINRIEREQNRIAHILSLMSPVERKNFEDVFHRKTTYMKLADGQYRSEKSLRRDVDREIYSALMKAEGEYSL